MHAAVDHVHHRHGQHVGVGPADVPVERHVEFDRGRLGDGEAGAEDRVGAELRLVVGAVEIEHELVDAALVERVEAFQRFGDVVVDETDGLADALAAVAIVAVTEFDRFVLAGRGAGGDRGAPERSGVEHDLDLDGGVAARVEDLAAEDADDVAHGRST